MIKTLTNQTIALAGLSQALSLVQQIAKRGIADREAMETCLASTLKIDSDEVLDVYGDLSRLAHGLRQLDQQLAEPDKVDKEQARYASTLVFLERKLMKQPAMVESIGVTLHGAAERAQAVGVLHEDVYQALAEAYQQTLSQLQPRVLVTGEQMYLADSDNGQRIRALLLAGIRSVVLWRQCGGARWRLLFYRTRMQQEARRLLRTL
ncbi:high frequency lysogenization protein HflD [Methylomagnum sp.]